MEIFLTRQIGGRRWSALLRPARRIASGETILFGEGELGVTVEGAEGGEWIVSLPDEMPSQRFINLYGRVPLPPYIRREANERDHERYQTLFARREGSVAAPTAGLHFSDAVLRDLRRRGITIAPVTLHVGPGTFRPLEKERVEENTLGRTLFRSPGDLGGDPFGAGNGAAGRRGRHDDDARARIPRRRPRGANG